MPVNIILGSALLCGTWMDGGPVIAVNMSFLAWQIR